MFDEEYEVTREQASAAPFSAAEVKERLKHIAGLCYGLTIDFNNSQVEEERLRARIKALKDELHKERELRLQYEGKLLELGQKKAIRKKTDDTKTDGRGRKRAELTPEEIEHKKAVQRERSREYQRKRKESMTPEQLEEERKRCREWYRQNRAKQKASDGNDVSTT